MDYTKQSPVILSLERGFERACERIGWKRPRTEAYLEIEAFLCENLAPRVESSMGFTVNGYNYREDLLRMAGNAVVEQTAELAFIELLNKQKNGR